MPLASRARTDVDGDGRAEELVYRIQQWEEDFEGSFTITSADGKVLWEHLFPMVTRDLFGLAYTEGEVTSREITIEDWVRHFFDGTLHYGAKIERVELRADDLHDDQIEFAAKKTGVDPSRLREIILSEPENLVFRYRAEWREDLMQIVYVRELGRFICFSRGY